jgi:hypothetical protein
VILCNGQLRNLPGVRALTGSNLSLHPAMVAGLQNGYHDFWENIQIK